MPLNLHDHFSRTEFACNCGCGFDTVDAELLHVLIRTRAEFGKPIRIMSGCRCERHNGNQGGSEKSKHIIGRAADIAIDTIHPDIVADFLEMQYPDKYGIGRYTGRTHIDTRAGKVRWDYRIKQ